MPVIPHAVPLSDDLELADTSLLFQVITLIGGVIAISVSRVLRDQLAGIFRLDKCDAAMLLRIRIFASIIVYVSLIYFFMAAHQTLQEAEEPDDYRSAKLNFMASFLVLMASALRLYDLNTLSPESLLTTEETEIEIEDVEGL